MENQQLADHQDCLPRGGRKVVGIPGGANKSVKPALRLPQRRKRRNTLYIENEDFADNCFYFIGVTHLKMCFSN